MPFSKTELKSNTEETQILAADKAQECQYRRQSFSANVSAKMPAYTFFLEKEMATRSSTFAWKIPWMEEPGRLQSMGSQRVGHDWATSLSFFL